MKKHLKDPVVLIFFTLGLVIILGALVLAWNQYRVESWPTVAAEVVSTQVVQNSHGRHEGRVQVKLGERLLTLTSRDTTDPADIEEGMSDWRPGSTLVLPQNPENPEDLRLPLDTLGHWVPWLVAFGGLAFILVPVGVVALTERKDAVRIIGAILVAAGLLFLGIGTVMTYRKTEILRNWPETEATILKSEVGRRPGNRRVQRGVDLVVEYKVGQELVRSAAGQRGSTMDLESVREAVATTYAPGRKLRVRYQPSSPHRVTFEAVWRLSYFWEALLFLGLGLVTALLGWLVGRYLTD